MMRKLFVALLVGAVAVGLAAPAFAADLKFTGAYRVRFQFDENLPCLADEEVTGLDCSGHQFQTRFRPRFDVETDGGVRGVLRLEIGDVRFGRIDTVTKGAGGGAGADGVNVETKWAYIDFPIPATPLRLRAGIQPFFPSKSRLLDDDGSGISLYGKLGEINANAWWFRANRAGGSGSFFGQLGAFDGSDPGTSAGSEGTDARDILGLDLSFSPMRDLNLNVYFVYDHDMESTDAAAAGTATILGVPIPIFVATPGGDSTTGFWIGAGALGKVQNIRWDLDFVYGTKETIHPLSGTMVDQKGWMVDGGVGMALPGTPLDLELRGWWATGWDGSGTGDIDAYPVLYGGSSGHEPGTQVWGGGGDIDIDALADNPQNTWGIGLIARYTATPNLKITGNVHYIGVPEEFSTIGDGFLNFVDAVGTEVGVKIDYTIARGLVFTLTAGHLLIEKEVLGFDLFDDVTKIAGVLNYGF